MHARRPFSSALLAVTLLLAGSGFAPNATATGILNDTGVTFCGGMGRIVHDCVSVHVSGEEASRGRDALARTGLLDKIGGSASNNGFDYSKISDDGRVLPASVSHHDSRWRCTRDNVTGLIWERKNRDPGHLRSIRNRYTWYDPSSRDGHPGEQGAPDTCALGGKACNTLNYIDAINQARLCGYTDWRLPTPEELLTLYNFADTYAAQGHNQVAAPPLDPEYFPVQDRGAYWSATPAAESREQAWVMIFGWGHLQPAQRSTPQSVRLVRGQRHLHGEPR